jgi:hypothetical protein
MARTGIALERYPGPFILRDGVSLSMSVDRADERNSHGKVSSAPCVFLEKCSTEEEGDGAVKSRG